MKKVSLIGLLAIAGLATSLSAGPSITTGYTPFGGFEIGSVKATVEGDDSDTEVSWGLRGGVENESSRIYLSGHYANWDDANAMDFLLNLEGRTSPYLLGDSLSTAFFVGGHLGLVYVDSDVLDDSTTDLAYGAQGGILLSFNPQVEFETGFRYTWSKASMEGYDLDHYYTIYGGMNFKF
jgi:hypothetical protein